MRCATINSMGCGAAHVYRWVNGDWTLHTRLVPNDETFAQRIGDSVATNGEFAAVSAREDDRGGTPNLNYGAVYMFRNVNGQWQQTTKLTASDGEVDDNFGYPLAMSGDVLVAAAAGDNCADGTGCGSAYVFRFDGQSWQFEQKLQSPLLHEYAGIAGISVHVDDDVIAIGVPLLINPSNQRPGGVLIYRFNGIAWVEEAVLYNYTFGNRFGSAVAVDGNRLAVVSPGEGAAGAVFLYEKAGAHWTLSETLVPSQQTPGDGYGLGALAFQGDALLCGAPYFPGSQQGIVHMFRQKNGAWTQVATITGSTTGSEKFGSAMSLNAGRFIVGAPGAFRNPGDFNTSGATYFFDTASLGCDCNLASCSIHLEPTSDCDGNTRLDDCEIEGRDCNGNQRLDACDVNFGGSSDSDNDGIPDECDCLSVAPIAAESPGLDKSRFISFVPGNPGHDKAIRVVLKSLHQVEPPYTSGETTPFTALEGEVRWVGPALSYNESTSDATPFIAAQLQCTPYFRNWGLMDLLHVTGSAIVPSSEYEVQIVGANCDIGAESSYSVPLVLRTTRWGDVESLFNPPSATMQPDVADIAALVAKFQSAPGAPIKTRALLAGDNAFGYFNSIEQDFGFSHIAACVDAFRGQPYPHTIQACP